MAKKKPEPTIPPRERAFLIGVEIYQQKSLLPLEDSLTELGLLADTAGLNVVGELTQKLEHPHVETYIGPGKVEELRALVEETLSQVVIFDDDLKLWKPIWNDLFQNGGAKHWCNGFGEEEGRKIGAALESRSHSTNARSTSGWVEAGAGSAVL